MKTKIVVSFLTAVILSACASTDSGKPVAAKDSEQKVYTTGSFLSHKSTDPAVPSAADSIITGDGVSAYKANIPPNTPLR